MSTPRIEGMFTLFHERGTDLAVLYQKWFTAQSDVTTRHALIDHLHERFGWDVWQALRTLAIARRDQRRRVRRVAVTMWWDTLPNPDRQLILDRIRILIGLPVALDDVYIVDGNTPPFLVRQKGERGGLTRTAAEIASADRLRRWRGAAYVPTHFVAHVGASWLHRLTLRSDLGFLRDLAPVAPSLTTSES